MSSPKKEDSKKKLHRPVEANQSEVVSSKLQEKKLATPAAWKPGVIFDGQEGEITSRPAPSPAPHWDDILASWGYDPEQYEIIEPVKVSTWEAQTPEGKEQMWSYKAGIRLRQDAESRLSYDDLLAEIRKHKPLKGKRMSGEATYVVCIADTQFGKGLNGGGGFKDTIERFLIYIDLVDERIQELKLLGRNMGRLLVVGMGDIIEQCYGNYASQLFVVEANRREQIRVARRLIRDAIIKWSAHFDEVIVSAVPGNHGENREGYKAITTPGDNDDVAIFEVLAEIFASNPEAYGHIKFHIPEDEIYVTFDLHGTVVGFTHGHITKGGGTPQAKIKNWWEGQTFGHQPIGDATILITGHYHHLSVIEHGRKTHIQCPSCDPGSEWWRDISGAESRPGLLTLVINSDGYQDLEVLGGYR